LITTSHSLPNLVSILNAKFFFPSIDGESEVIISENDGRVATHLVLSEPPSDPSGFRVPDIVLVPLDDEETTLLGNRSGLINKGDDLSVGETVDVIHYGWLASDITGTPLQFSLVDNFTVFEKRNMGPIITLIHTAHTAPGSSGAPNFSAKGKVVGIQFAGSDGKAISLHIENALNFVDKATVIFSILKEYQQQQAIIQDNSQESQEIKEKAKKAVDLCLEKLKAINVGYLGIIGVLPDGSIIPRYPPIENLLRSNAGDIWLGQTKRQPLQTLPMTAIYATKDTSKPLVTDCQLCLSAGWASVESFSKPPRPSLNDKGTYYFGHQKELYSGMLFKVSNLPKSTRYYFQDVRKL